MQSNENWIDVSLPIYTGMVVWPSDGGVVLQRDADMEKGDKCNTTRMQLGAHTGTHMDAPRHFVRDGKTIDQLPLDAVLGPARVIGIDDGECIRREVLEGCALQPGERVLFRTSNSERCYQTDDFVTDYVYISLEAAEYLAECGVQTVGIDYLSVGGYKKKMAETHRALLGAGIWLIEGLQLADVTPGDYQLICLPLKLVGRDGSPVRAILRPLG